MPEQRMLLVHAHPDDETIGQGGTMAKYAAEGRGVTLVTCTAGELGEILVPELEHLAAHREDRLGEHRKEEIANAMAALGVTDQRFLGGFGTYRDSGMAWHEDGHAVAAEDVSEHSFWHADLLEAANHLVAVIREVRPQVMVTYNEFGGYGHPDHIKAHQVAMYAASLAAADSYRRDLGEAWDIAKIYWGAMSESMMREGLRMLRESGDTETFAGIEPDGSLPMASPGQDIAACIDATGYVDAKVAAFRAYPTQIAADSFFFTMADVFSGMALGLEFYRLVKGSKGPVGDNGFETDLFAGLEPA